MEEVDVLLRHIDNYMVAQFADRSHEFAWVAGHVWRVRWSVRCVRVRGGREQDRLILPPAMWYAGVVLI